MYYITEGREVEIGSIIEFDTIKRIEKLCHIQIKFPVGQIRVRDREDSTMKLLETIHKQYPI